MSEENDNEAAVYEEAELHAEMSNVRVTEAVVYVAMSSENVNEAAVHAEINAEEVAAMRGSVQSVVGNNVGTVRGDAAQALQHDVRHLNHQLLPLHVQPTKQSQSSATASGRLDCGR